MTRIAVVIPSIARKSLSRTVESAAWADEVLVVFDGPDYDVPSLPAGTRVAFFPEHDAANNWGHAQRNWALARFKHGFMGVTHVSFMDDDDWYSKGAGDLIRAAVEAEPDVMHVFRMRRGGVEFGREHRLEGGMVGTPMMVVPAHTHGVWGDRYEGDLDFAVSTAELLPVVWHDEVTALIGEPL